MRILHVMFLLGFLAMGPVGCAADTQEVTIADRQFTLELALTNAQRSTGLMHREQIDENGGMLFVFPNADVRHFWMKNCLVDMDVIFLDGLGYVVSYHTMTAPAPGTPDADLPHWSSGRPAQFAIELRAGTADKLGIKRGQKIELPLDALKARAR